VSEHFEKLTKVTHDTVVKYSTSCLEILKCHSVSLELTGIIHMYSCIMIICCIVPINKKKNSLTAHKSTYERVPEIVLCPLGYRASNYKHYK